MQRVALIVVGLSVAFASIHAFPRVVNDDGYEYKISARERQQIEQIISDRADIHKPLETMILHDDGVAECYSAVYRVGSDEFVTSFDLIRDRGGNWRLDEKSVRQVKGEPRPKA